MYNHIYLSTCVCVCVSMSNPPAQAWYADHSIESVRNIIQTYRPRNDKDFTRGIYTHRTLKPNKETLYHLFKDYIIYVFHHLTEERRLFTLICWCSNFKHTVWYVESIWKKIHLIDCGVTRPKAIAHKEKNCLCVIETVQLFLLCTSTIYTMFVINATLQEELWEK